MLRLIYDFEKIEVPDVTEKFYNSLFAPIPKGTNVQVNFIQIYGAEGSGKSTWFRDIANRAFKRYGDKNVNAIISIHLTELISKVNSKPVQLLFLDDAGADIDNQNGAKKLIAAKTIIRRALESKRSNGIMIVFYGVQDLTLIDKKLRSFIPYEGWKHSPTNPHDINVLKSQVGYTAFKHLWKTVIDWKKHHNYASLSYPIVKIVDEIGYVKVNNIQPDESKLIELTTSYKKQAINEIQFTKTEKPVAEILKINPNAKYKQIRELLNVGTGTITDVKRKLGLIK